MSSRVSTPGLAAPSVPSPRDRTSLLKRFESAQPDTSSVADVNGSESAAAQTGADRSKSPEAAREVVRSSMAVLVVMSAGCLFVWCTAHLIQSLLQAELFVLRANLPFHP